ncbi:MAG: GntR family transcriptional regulator [Burkholderiales bacterium]|nr:GntR family transcriptional regulator [Burkholderiales bacterium]
MAETKEGFFQARKPRYLELAERITREIGEGAHEVGSLLPSEAKLCAAHRVSRHTVREATRVLQELGLVVRQQGRGTRVRSSKVVSRYVFAMDAIPDLWDYVKHTELRVIRRRLIAARDAMTPLPGPGSRRWRLVEAVRCADSGDPIAWKQVYIDARYDRVLSQIGQRQVPIYALIEQRYGIRAVKVRQDISAVDIPGEAARGLRVIAGSCGLAILRHYVASDDTVFEVTMSVYPADRFRYSVELKLEYGNGGR